MTTPLLDAVFAEFNDSDICNSWCKAYERQQTFGQEGFPVSQIVESVWSLDGLWSNGGMALMLQADGDLLIHFVDSLHQIGKHYAAYWMKATLDKVGLERLRDEHYLLSEEYLILTRELDVDWECHRDGLVPALATFVRKHRSEALAFIDDLARIAAHDRAEREK